MTDKNVSNELKVLALEMINNAGSGHSGSVLSMTDAIYTLYTRHILTDGTKHQLRDRLVLSAGHVCASLYAVLAGMGYLEFDELKKFRQFGSVLAGHPEIEIPPVDCGTGPLGQGVANAVGMAIAETIMNKHFGEEHYTYCVAGDGCLQEGVALEALSVAGLYQLNKFILLYDKNNVTLDGSLKQSSIDDFKLKFKSMNFNVLECDGYNIKKIDKAILKAKSSKTKPTVIILNTTIGKGTSFENSNKSHGAVLSIEEIETLKQKLTVKKEFLNLSDETKEFLDNKKSEINSKFKEKITKFNENIGKNKEKLKKYNNFIKNNKNYKIKLNKDEKENRKVNNIVLNQICATQENVVALSADLSSSTKVKIENGGVYSAENRLGKNINIGIREHAMCAIANGIALHGGLVPIASTFLVFSQYALPAIRMAGIMNLPVIFTFSHSTAHEINDGITHIPVEQIDQLRLIPNLTTFRPFDMAEFKSSYDWFYENKRPMCLCVSKTKDEPTLSKEDMGGGAYFVTNDKAQINLLSSGADLSIAFALKKELEKENIVANVVSMLSLEVFESQHKQFKNKFFNKPTFILETSTCAKYFKYVPASHIFNVSKFGTSGDSVSLKAYYGFDLKTLQKNIKKLIKFE